VKLNKLFFDLEKEIEVSQFSEALASKLALTCAEELAHHNKIYITQVSPDISRVDSSNVNPLDFWNCGVQLVAMNYQVIYTNIVFMNFIYLLIISIYI
jgi:hypothetical protein